MPTKLGKGGTGQQNYIPAGHGDASGEYGDDATGSNKHFQTFKKPKQFKKYWKKIGPMAKSAINIFEYEKLKSDGADVEEEELDISLTPEEEKLVDEALNEVKIDGTQLIDYALANLKSKINYKLNFKTFDDRYFKSTVIAGAYFDELTEKWNEARAKEIEKGKKALDDFNKIDGDHSYQDDLTAVNKQNYYKSIGTDNYNAYHSNCQRCVQAYLLRRLGYDVEAEKYLGKNDNLPRWSFAMFLEPKNGYKKYKQNDLGKTTKKQFEKINEIVKNDKNGSIYFCSVKWSHSNNSHIFIVEKQDDKVRFIDPQSGADYAETYFEKSWDGTYKISPSWTELTKVDNLDINGNYLKKVAKNK